MLNHTAIEPAKSAKDQNQQEAKATEVSPIKSTPVKVEKRLLGPGNVPMSVPANDSGSAAKKSSDDRGGDRYSFSFLLLYFYRSFNRPRPPTDKLRSEERHNGAIGGEKHRHSMPYSIPRTSQHTPARRADERLPHR